MRRGFFARCAPYLVLFAVSFAVTFGVMSLAGRPDGRTPPPDTRAPRELSPVMSEPMPQAQPVQQAQPVSQPMTQAPPKPASVAPPHHDEPAPDGYFSDALFFGNSLLEGLGLYAPIYDTKIAGAAFDTATSMNIFEAQSYIDDAATGGYGKIYIGLGLNEIGYDYEAIREENEAAIDTIRAGNPNAIIYLISLTPLSRDKSENDELYNNENSAAISEVLREVAEEKGCYFMDMVPVLAGSDGYLPADVTTDGVHFVKEYYTNWYDYLEHNYVLPEGGE